MALDFKIDSYFMRYFQTEYFLKAFGSAIY